MDSRGAEWHGASRRVALRRILSFAVVLGVVFALVAGTGSLLPARMRGVEEFLTRHGAVAVLESRIVPLLPYGLVNYSAGLTYLRYRDMALGTAVGAAPKVFAYVALGGSLSDLGSPEAIVAISLLVALSLAGALFVRRRIALGRA